MFFLQIHSVVLITVLLVASTRGFQIAQHHEAQRAPTSTSLPVATLNDNIPSDKSWFAKRSKNDDTPLSMEQLKAQVLQLGCALDRGQAYNPTSGAYYSGVMLAAKKKVQELVSRADPDIHIPKTLKDIEGEWELVFATVPHGIFRSSPFFLAIQEAFQYAEDTKAFGQDKANLFFKLHELQTCSFGVSKVGRVAQRIDPESKYIYSEFDTSIFSLTVIPILGWFKLLPTFGGCVITASTCDMLEGGKLAMTVDYTTSRKVPGLSGLGEWIWSVKVPVGFIWKLLPWNKGRAANCSVEIVYCDKDFRIAKDLDGELFVYTRPIVSRDLDLMSLGNN
jgi:hypothetical protein